MCAAKYPTKTKNVSKFRTPIESVSQRSCHIGRMKTNLAVQQAVSKITKNAKNIFWVSVLTGKPSAMSIV